MASKRKKVLSIVGARPQFIKLAPLAKRLTKPFRHIIIHTGQHYDRRMSDIFFTQLHIPSPDENLGVRSGSHGKQTGRMLVLCEKAILKYNPDMVLIYGDTNTTLAGALAAAKLHFPIGHIESGLRSFNKAMPEEINRKMTDHISDLLFYPTPVARKNLVNEGISKGLIRSGDLMYEMLDACMRLSLFKKAHYKNFGLERRKYCLVTLHRAENTDNPERMRMFVSMLRSLPYPALFLVHPRTAKSLKQLKLLADIERSGHIIISPPLSYIETLSLLSQAKALLTDSGGMQKEAYFLGCPCMTLRPETEWSETVEAGANTLVDMSRSKVLHALAKPSIKQRKRNYMIRGRRPSDIITKAIGKFLQNK